MFNSLSAQVLDNVRNQFPRINSLEEAELHMELLENEKGTNCKAYYAAMLFMKSKYVKFPLTKYSYFKKGKTALDVLVKENKTNIEMRYIRFLFQNQMPAFLNYDKNLEEDYSVITEGIEKSDLSIQFKHKILNNMLLVKNISIDQTTQINLLLNKI
jgi:hypothetical protein